MILVSLVFSYEIHTKKREWQQQHQRKRERDVQTHKLKRVIDMK